MSFFPVLNIDVDVLALRREVPLCSNLRNDDKANLFSVGMKDVIKQLIRNSSKLDLVLLRAVVSYLRIRNRAQARSSQVASSDA